MFEWKVLCGEPGSLHFELYNHFASREEALECIEKLFPKARRAIAADGVWSDDHLEVRLTKHAKRVDFGWIVDAHH